ncbi:MAG: nucleotidyltransferase family protein [Rikenellaceae bacterium]|nr:nucleotidyltransferase family protein [Rikenellaceae bacterium]
MDRKFNDRTYLHDRHRLSHQQIDKLLGENRAAEFMSEKVKLLEDVKSLLHITDLLTKNGIHFVCLKGALLSYRLYKDPAVRISHDIDILINKDSVGQAADLLQKSGFDLSKGVIWPTQISQRDLILKNEQHLSFYNNSMKCCFEIHWTLMHGLAVTQNQLEKIINDNLVSESLAGRELTTLSRELELVFLLIHGSRHAWCRLKWLVDIKDYPFDEIDKDKFYELVKMMEAGRIVSQTNILLKKLFNVIMPFKENVRLPKRLVNYPLHALDDTIEVNLSLKEHIQLLRYKWYMFSSPYYKFRFFSTLFYRGGDLSVIDSASPIGYYLYRPYGLIKRRLFNAR